MEEQKLVNRQFPKLTPGEAKPYSNLLIQGETNVQTKNPTKLGWILTYIYVYVIV